jgi:endonuclease III
MLITKQITTTLDILKKHKGQTMLDQYQHLPPFQLLIMTLLSARSKDSTVIPIALKLFQDHPTTETMLQLNPNQLADKIRGIGFHNTKAKHILKLCHQLIQDFNSQVPSTLEQLITLPGVGRKTANCILSYVFKVPAIAVDIHVHRITNHARLNWINTKTPEQSEQQLMQIVPKNRWIEINQLIVDHGQRICKPIKPNCHLCKISNFCKFPIKNPS